MKKKILMLLTLFAGVLCASADNTVSVSTALIPQGKTGSFNIELTNSDAFVAFQMALTLPEGITFESATKGNRYEESHSLGMSQNGQTVTFTINSGTNEAIRGNSGALITINVFADADVEVGSKLTATLSNMEFARRDETFIRPDAFDFDIEITDRVVLDENSTIVPTATDAEVNILVKRTIKAGQWSTICLPFDMTEEQLKAAFGSDVELAEYIEHEMNEEATAITVTFEEAFIEEDGLMANYPYIIKTSGDISDFTVDSVIVNPDEEGAIAEYDNGQRGARRKVLGTLQGTLHAGIIVPEYCLFLSDNQFWYSSGLTMMKAFRAYFDFKDDILEGVVQEATSRISFNIVGHETTSIRQVHGDRSQEALYDLQGRRVAAAEAGAVPVRKGVYVRNGRKEIVK